MIIQKIKFRIARADELETIVALQEDAFGEKAERQLVHDLVLSAAATLSLLAEFKGSIIGHILLSEIGAPVKALTLAPLAVLPAYREMQIGCELVRRAIDMAVEQDYQVIFVLGDPNYYERFGFSSPLADSFDCPWQGRNFMAKELQEDALKGRNGPLIYPKAFSELG